MIDIAADKIAQAGLTRSHRRHGGDFFADALPPGHDVHLFSMIMHDWNQEHDRGSCCANPSMRSRTAAWSSSASCSSTTTRPGRPPAALMSLNMLIETEGRNYTASDTPHG